MCAHKTRRLRDTLAGIASGLLQLGELEGLHLLGFCNL
jgi:hypothetical protein